MEMPEPTDKKGIQRLLGLINYVARFLPKLSKVKNPLRDKRVIAERCTLALGKTS